MKPAIRTSSRLFRTSIARGVAHAENDLPAVDPMGGDQHAGIIRGMAILTRGEALGHGLWCDLTTLEQCVEEINSTEKGAKARFTHPDISGDGLGKYTGRVKNARLEDGDIVRGDLHFSKSAHETPDGDLAGYLMKLAAEDPEAFGNSIAFNPDLEAEDFFLAENSTEGEFASPDPDNAANLPHARIDQLMAVDAVDEPAANPSGLFHRGPSADLISDSEQLLAFSLGLSNKRPTLKTFDADPERVAGFVQRFLTRHNLALSVKDPKMTTAELDAQLRQHFSTGKAPPPKTVKTTAPAKPARKLAALAAGPEDEEEEDKEEDLEEEADKEDKGQQVEKAAQEEGDADKDEGHDKGQDEKRGDDYARKCASDEGDGDDDEKEKMADPEDAKTGLADGSGDEDDENPEKADKDGPETKKAKKMRRGKLAKGGEAPGGTAAGDEAARQKAYQDVQEEEEEESKKPAKKGTTVESPGTEPGAVGPLGDPSHNVGYAAAVKECRRFAKAFGAQGPIWFTDGKTFAEAQELHAKAIAAERDELKKENEKLKARLSAKRGIEPLSHGETSVASGNDKPGLATFTAGLAVQLNRKNLN